MGSPKSGAAEIADPERRRDRPLCRGAPWAKGQSSAGYGGDAMPRRPSAKGRMEATTWPGEASRPGRAGPLQCGTTGSLDAELDVAQADAGASEGGLVGEPAAEHEGSRVAVAQPG